MASDAPTRFEKYDKHNTKIKSVNRYVTIGLLMDAMLKLEFIICVALKEDERLIGCNWTI